MTENCLIVFQKNPQLGKVKTRLAKDIGEETALEVYLLLLEQTQSIALKSNASVEVYYSEFVDENDLWPKDTCIKYVQRGNDLGERINEAIISSFKRGAEKIVLIGSDCPELTESEINTAFLALDSADMVIGPAQDGGFYLIGMSAVEPNTFKDISWSTSAVLSQTINNLERLEKSYTLLPVLNDLDTYDDLKGHSEIINSLSSLNEPI